MAVTQFRIGSLAAWAVSPVVPLDRQLVAARRPDGTAHAKFGDGILTFTALPELFVDPGQIDDHLGGPVTGLVNGSGVVQEAKVPALSISAATVTVARGLSWKIATDPAYGADPTGVADATAALQACLSAAAASGTTAYAVGTFKTSGAIAVTGAADLHLAVINYTGTTGTAVTVGVASPSYTIRKAVRLPQIVAAAKTVSGWAQVAGTVGVLLQNSYNVDVTVPRIYNFETGLEVSGDGNGVSYCTTTLGHLDNNKRNLRFAPSATGWSNQNTFIGGRMSHNSNEGTVVSGTRHVLIELGASKVNNNVFVGTSLESPNVVEYHLDCAGNDNYFDWCRWENTGTGARIIWRANSIGNVIHYGFGSHTIVETKEANTANDSHTRARSRMVGDGGGTVNHAVLALENTASSSKAALRIMEAGAESTGAAQATAWAVEVSALAMKGKRAADTQDRARLDLANGRLYVGNGAVATTRYFGNVGTSMGFDGADVAFITDNTYDLGMATLRPRYIRAGTAIRTGTFATGSRPAAATAGAGAMIFDTTLGKPIFSNGTAWVDATGATV